jgi:hypothetical protein
MYNSMQVARPFNDGFSSVTVDYLIDRRDLARGFRGTQFLGFRACRYVDAFHNRVNLHRTCDGLLTAYEQRSLTEIIVKQALPYKAGHYTLNFFTVPASPLPPLYLNV